jgi:hypothetical protein
MVILSYLKNDFVSNLEEHHILWLETDENIADMPKKHKYPYTLKSTDMLEKAKVLDQLNICLILLTNRNKKGCFLNAPL